MNRLIQPDEALQVLRRNANRECGQLIGHIHAKLSTGAFESIKFFCTKRQGHRDECAFEGVEMVVTRRRRG